MKIYKEVRINMATGEETFSDAFDYDGPVDLCCGSSGDINFPDYLESFHHSILNQGWSAGGTVIDYPDVAIVDLANVAWGVGGNPYEGEVVYDPDTRLNATQTKVTSHDSLVSARDERTDWGNALDKAVSEVDATLFTEAEVDAAVEAYEESLNARYLREVNRLTGTFMEVNGVVSSAFPIALSLARQGVEQEVNRFEQSLRVDKMQRKFAFVTQSINEMSTLLRDKVAADARALGLITDANRLHVIAKSNEQSSQVDLDAKEALWDFEIMGFVQSAMSAIHGAPSTVSAPKLGAPMGALAGGAGAAALLATSAPVSAPIAAGVIGIGALIGALQGG